MHPSPGSLPPRDHNAAGRTWRCLYEFLQAPCARSGGRFGAGSRERCVRGALLDQARLAVADAEMRFREKRSGLCPFVGCVGLLPELLRCDEVRDGFFFCAGRESDRTERVFGRCK